MIKTLSVSHEGYGVSPSCSLGKLSHAFGDSYILRILAWLFYVFFMYLLHLQ